MKSNWPKVRLGDLVEIKHGYAFKGKFFSESPTPYQLVTPANFAIGGGFQDGKKKFYCGDIPEEYILSQGDLLVTMTDLSRAADTLGYAAQVPKATNLTWLHNQRVGLVNLKLNAPADADFLHYLMRSPEYRHWVVSTATGSTVKHTSPGRICDYVFHLPPIDVQKAIAGMLRLIDERITLHKEINSTLEALSQALFKSWFIDFEPVHAKLERREAAGLDEKAAALFPDCFADSELGKVPKGWRVEKFEDFIKRLSVGKKFDKKTALVDGSVPILDQGKSGIIGFHNEIAGINASLEKPVIVFANHTCYMRLINYDFSVIQNVLPFIGKGVDTVWAFFSTKDRIKFTEYKGHWPDFAVEKTIVPGEELTKVFRRAVDPLLSSARHNDLQAQSLASIRDILLPRLISGRISLTTTDDQIGTSTAEAHD